MPASAHSAGNYSVVHSHSMASFSLDHSEMQLSSTSSSPAQQQPGEVYRASPRGPSSMAHEPTYHVDILPGQKWDSIQDHEWKALQRPWICLHTLSGDSFWRNAQIDTKAFQLSAQAKELTVKAKRDILRSTSYKTMHTIYCKTI